MTIKNIFVHVGLYKTGTSALQTLFFYNQEKLLGRGVKYALTGLRGGAHFELARVCRSELQNVAADDFNLLKVAFHQEVTHTKTDALLFSCEDFERCDEKLLGEFFEGQPVKIIVYLRRQDLFAESWAAQMEKMGIFYGNEDRYAPISHLPPAEKAKILCIDYRAWLARLASVFGKENIIVRAYEKQQLPNGIEPDFFDILDLVYPGDLQMPVTDPNPSLRFRDLIEYKYLANQSPVPGDPLRSLLTQLELSWRNDTDRPPALPLLSPRERIKILEKYDSDNQYIAREYMQQSDGILFREPWPSVDEPWHAYGGLSTKALVEISAWIAAKQQVLLQRHNMVISNHERLINMQKQYIEQLQAQIKNT